MASSHIMSLDFKALRLRGGGLQRAWKSSSASFRGPSKAPAATVRGGKSAGLGAVPEDSAAASETQHASSSWANVVARNPSPAPTVTDKSGNAGVAQTAEQNYTNGEGDAYYFNSYSHFGIHEEMLKDEVRTLAYRDALLKNAHILKGKVVLDLGCGTGILSMFAAQAGAAHVYAVDCSAMADTAFRIVQANGFSDRITVIRGEIEQVTLPVDKVDVIVSEWMGYSLLYETMFDSVIFARDKWLKPGGMLMPDKAAIYLCGIEDAKYKNEKIFFWDQVYGFNMSCIRPAALSEPLVDTVDPGQIATTTACVWEADLLTIDKAGMQVDSAFNLTALRNDYIHALVLHFDVGFTQGHKPIWMTTSPREKWTHWRQTVLYLHDDLAAARGQTMQGRLAITPGRENKRHLDYRLDYEFHGDAVNGERLLAPHRATHLYRMR
uniref:type I protein arginine methyltransferase n=1 Tax=Cryptomonas curvata TaxID=233186 RepID=A0A7S0N8X0_9CRYP